MREKIKTIALSDFKEKLSFKTSENRAFQSLRIA